MKNQVTIIPADKLIIVNGVECELDFPAPENIHAIQWYGVSGHCEFTDGTGNKELTIEDYKTYIEPYVNIWETEVIKQEEQRREEEKQYNTLENTKKRAVADINNTTHNAIIAGFTYTINEEPLHFSYNLDDQQNFSDTFNGITMKRLMGIKDLPETIDWNGWRNHNFENKGELVILTLTPDMFITLYTQGAFAHKQTHLEIGKERKKAIEQAETVEEINKLIAEWNI